MDEASNAEISRPYQTPTKGSWRIRAAAVDIWTGMTHWWMWTNMAWQDIRQRYRGSTLGPFWLTLSMAIMIASLGTLYSVLMNMDIRSYLPNLCLGLLFWTTLSTLTNEGCNCFISAHGTILQSRMPFTVHAMRSVARNFIILCHNSLVAVAVLLIFGIPQSLYSLTSLVGVALIFVNGFWMTLLLGIFCTRFRDVGQIVSSMMQVLFFVTPILWHPRSLGTHQWVAMYNPIYSLIQLARGPLLGERPSMDIWLIALTMTISGLTVTFFVFSRFRGRIAYWL